jgi:flagellar L-ring protein precursor FlgH
MSRVRATAVATLILGTRSGAIAIAALSLAATGCAVRRPPPIPALTKDMDRLVNELAVLPPFPQPVAASGSLWTDGGPGAALVRDPRAFRLNDLVTIVLQEQSLGANESDTALERSSSASFGASVAFGLEDPTPRPGRFNLAQVLDTSSESTFSGEGATTRSSRLLATITGRVMLVLPNGDLVIAAQKSVMVNRERQILTLVGSVRPVDVGPDNRVPSTAVGDLTVRLWGEGEIDDTIRQGWFMRVMNVLWPF